jgi:hypothetical protein
MSHTECIGRNGSVNIRKILFMPFGPSVDLTKSPNAIAPTKDDKRAFSPLSSVACACQLWHDIVSPLVASCDCQHRLQQVSASCKNSRRLPRYSYCQSQRLDPCKLKMRV